MPLLSLLKITLAFWLSFSVFRLRNIGIKGSLRDIKKFLTTQTIELESVGYNFLYEGLKSLNI